jgi:hypothetical protein
MIGKKLVEILRHLDLLSISIPIGVLVASALSLPSIARQALIGIMLVWFGLEAINGFQFWR